MRTYFFPFFWLFLSALTRRRRSKEAGRNTMPRFFPLFTHLTPVANGRVQYHPSDLRNKYGRPEAAMTSPSTITYRIEDHRFLYHARSSMADSSVLLGYPSFLCTCYDMHSNIHKSSSRASRVCESLVAPGFFLTAARHQSGDMQFGTKHSRHMMQS